MQNTPESGELKVKYIYKSIWRRNIRSVVWPLFGLLNRSRDTPILSRNQNFWCSAELDLPLVDEPWVRAQEANLRRCVSNKNSSTVPPWRSQQLSSWDSQHKRKGFSCTSWVCSSLAAAPSCWFHLVERMQCQISGKAARRKKIAVMYPEVTL